MTKTTASLAAFALFGLGILGQAAAANAQPYGDYPPERVEWKVGPGFYGFSGYPWPGPPFALPDLRPTLGCYFTHARLKNAWREVEVCS